MYRRQAKKIIYKRTVGDKKYLHNKHYHTMQQREETDGPADNTIKSTIGKFYVEHSIVRNE